MNKSVDGSLEMKQTGRIDQILEAKDLDTKLATNTWTPAKATPLIKDEDGEGPQCAFSYISVVRMLLYLSGHTHPAMSYAVHCCARYTFNPKLSDEKALKRIERYLKATGTIGLVFNPTGNLNANACPYSDFTVLYGHDNPNDTTCTKRQTGDLISLSGCPVVWVRMLQRETALLTMEAEVNALSQCCRDLCPLMHMVAGIGQVVGLPTKYSTKMNVSIHEDNAGAISMALYTSSGENIPAEYWLLSLDVLYREITK